jgi:hypothetical protein
MISAGYVPGEGVVADESGPDPHRRDTGLLHSAIASDLRRKIYGQQPADRTLARTARPRRHRREVPGGVPSVRFPVKIASDRSLSAKDPHELGAATGRKNLAWGRRSIQGELIGLGHLVVPSWPPHRAACTAPAGDGTLE